MTVSVVVSKLVAGAIVAPPNDHIHLSKIVAYAVIGPAPIKHKAAVRGTIIGKT